ncbi:MAG: response regulator [Alphaproteobacteria bacterium]
MIDDDNRLRNLLKKYLLENGFYVSTAEDTKNADKMISIFNFDLLIVDVMMPGEDGFSFVLRFRKENMTPILMLTAMSEVNERITGLEYGADDYLPKPFEPKELLLRINNILKRIPKNEKPRYQNIKFGDSCYNPNTGKLTYKDVVVHLSPVEKTLLKIMTDKLGQIVSRETLADLTFSGQNLRTVDVQITRLRKKIEPDTKEPKFLQTIRGKGYILLPE